MRNDIYRRRHFSQVLVNNDMSLFGIIRVKRTTRAIRCLSAIYLSLSYRLYKFRRAYYIIFLYPHPLYARLSLRTALSAMKTSHVRVRQNCSYKRDAANIELTLEINLVNHIASQETSFD